MLFPYHKLVYLITRSIIKMVNSVVFRSPDTPILQIEQVIAKERFLLFKYKQWVHASFVDI